MRMHGACPVRTARGPSAAADCLVVAKRRVAEEQVIHRSLTSRGHVQCSQKHVNDTLRCFHVPTDHGGALFDLLLRWWI